jgi:acyl carrier protein phosphodiesterase
MNFLAHLALSSPHEQLMLGNFLGDLVSNRELQDLQPAVAAGVRMHRQIDWFTDQHPATRQSIARLRPVHGKYAPVVVDVFYDYLLSCAWKKWYVQPLEEFHEYAYKVLLEQLSLIPLRLHSQVEAMVADRWLRHYTSIEGIGHTFMRLQRRVSQPALIDGVGESLREQQAELMLDFETFYPAIQAFTREQFLSPRNGSLG